MQVVYIAHPLRGDWAENLAEAKRYGLIAARIGLAPCLPYAMLDPLLDDTVEADRALGTAFDMALLAKCDLIWLCGGRLSEGVRAEATEAFRRGLPVWAARLAPLRASQVSAVLSIVEVGPSHLSQPNDV